MKKKLPAKKTTKHERLTQLSLAKLSDVKGGPGSSLRTSPYDSRDY